MTRLAALRDRIRQVRARRRRAKIKARMVRQMRRMQEERDAALRLHAAISDAARRLENHLDAHTTDDTTDPNSPHFLRRQW